MSKDIKIVGAETNNLKNINVSIKKNAINVIIGPSGSGKSSLAYDTIAQIGQYEFNSMFSDRQIDPYFKVKFYSNIIATVPIKQTNQNSNIRSTIGTYFNLNTHLAKLYSAALDTPYNYFVLNKEENLCPQCHGIGFQKKIDINKSLYFNTPLNKCPIKCWKRYKDFYISIIKQFCNDTGIDSNKKFKDLDKKDQDLFLNGVSSKKYSIRYKKLNAYSRRTTKFYGLLTEKPMLPKFNIGKDFYTEEICSICNGEKYSIGHRDFKLNGLSIGETMCTSFAKLSNWVDQIKQNEINPSITFSLDYLSNFINKAIDLNLSHLYLNRSIPSLSGGELQRIRLVQVFNTQLTDLLIVLDEPLAGLSSEEKKIVYNNIKKISLNHTVLVIDHHDIFFKKAKNIIALGEKSGKYGGNLISTEKYLQSISQDFPYAPQKESETQAVILTNQVYSYSGVNITIAKNKLNIISGNSGIGKSTLLREYFSQFFEKYKYITQKSLHGNANSSVATALNIYTPILDLFTKKYKKEKTFFSNHTGSDGACKACGGSGVVSYGNNYDEIKLICKECEGTGFNKKLYSYKIFGNTLFDIWKLTLDEAYHFFQEHDHKIANRIYNAKEVMLEHLLIGQPTSTLSGGENIRVKILKSLSVKSEVFGIDEPFRGLNKHEIYKLIVFLNKLVCQNKTIIVVDHEEDSFKYFTRHMLLKNENCILVGKPFNY